MSLQREPGGSARVARPVGRAARASQRGQFDCTLLAAAAAPHAAHRAASR